MNPFTRFLSQWSSNRNMHEFVEHWDTLESIVIRVYRSGTVSAADEANYQAVRRWMNKNYGDWENDLAPFGQASKVGGTVEHADPFLYLTAFENAAEFLDNWAAMQYLPAAREALNGLIVQITGE